MKSWKMLYLAGGILLILAKPVLADTITLNSGEKIEGKITHENSQYVRIIGVKSGNYFRDDIASINKTNPDSKPADKGLNSYSIEQLRTAFQDALNRNDEVKTADIGIILGGKLIAQNQDSYEGYKYIGSTLYHMGKLDKAKYYLEKAKSLNPNDESVNMKLKLIK